jgi:hypothetical protein
LWVLIPLRQASTLTFFLTCPFGQLTKKSTCPTYHDGIVWYQ